MQTRVRRRRRGWKRNKRAIKKTRRTLGAHARRKTREEYKKDRSGKN